MTHLPAVSGPDVSQPAQTKSSIHLLSALQGAGGCTVDCVVGDSDRWAAPVGRVLYPADAEYELPATGEAVLSVFEPGALFERLDGRSAGKRGGQSPSVFAFSNGEEVRRYASLRTSGVRQIYLGRSLFERVSWPSGTGASLTSQLAERVFLKDPTISRLAQEYAERAVDGTMVPSALEMDARAVVLLLTVLRNSSKMQSGKSQKLRALTKSELASITDYIDSNLGNTIHIHDLSAIMKCSEGHFSELFKFNFGSTPHQYLISRRLEASKQRLIQFENIAAIAIECGFASQQHFATVFRKVFGKTPTAWQREHVGVLSLD